ncbi:MAG: hypothetical protein II038_05875 [Lachnospiraceae bacterium]|nr:hypothetical protein [Lachnospiraceae bacterium]
MNKKVLYELFDGYISKFDIFNMPEPGDDENYKWEAVANFQRVFDLDAEDFASVLKKARKASRNLVDSTVQPFGGLVVMAEEKGESETIRGMFRDLFEADKEDLAGQQRRIDEFLRQCDILLEKHFPGSFMYRNDQRSAMAYLWLHDPERYYLCKTTEAGYFAKCVGFYDDWGTYANFKLPVYYRFCDELVAAIREYQPLVNTHISRFENTTRTFHPDHNLHILAFDLIFCVGHYNLFGTNQPLSSQEIKLYLAQKEKAKQHMQAVQDAEAGLQDLYTAREAIIALLQRGAAVRHKSFGPASFKRMDGLSYCFTFGDNPAEKKYMLAAFADDFLRIDDPSFDEIVAKYASAMRNEYSAQKKLKSAKAALLPYEQFLD